MVFVFVVISLFSTQAYAQDKHTVTVTDFRTVIRFDDNGDLYRTWLNIHAEIVTEADCVTDVIFAFEIFPEIFVDEILFESPECPVYEHGTAFNAASDFADLLEPMLQYDEIPTSKVKLAGLVTSEQELFWVLHTHSDAFKKHVIWNGSRWVYFPSVHIVRMPVIVR